MRVSTAFNRVLNLPGARVDSVSFTDAGIVIGLRRRARRLTCPCGWSTGSRYDASRRRWRHLDFGACKVFLEAEVRRLHCHRCGRVRTELVPWARPGARFSRDFEDLVGWLAQRMDKTSVAKFLRCSWEAVDAIVKRVVAEHLDDDRLNNLYRIGVDEICYRRGRRFLTVVADHDTGKVVWVVKGHRKDSFASFFDALGEQRTAELQAVSLDASKQYGPVAAERAPRAALCIDPFHVIKWCNEALDNLYRAQPAPPPERLGKGAYRNTAWRQMRFALRAGADRLDEDKQSLVNGLRRANYRLFRAWQLKEQLREIYRSIHPDIAASYLKRWCSSALRSKIPGYRNVVWRIRRHFDAIVAAIKLKLSNSRLEGINAKIRLIQRRGFGHATAESLISMIYLCLGGIDIKLPTET